MARLTKARSERLAAELHNKATEKAKYDLHVAGDKLARDIVEHLLGDHKETVESLPDDFMPITRELYVSAYSNAVLGFLSPDITSIEDFNKPGDRFEYVTAPAMAANRPLSPGLLSEELHLRLKQHADKCREVREKSRSLRERIRAQLRSLTTVEKLKKEWPEAYKVYLDMYPAGTTCDLPSTDVRSLQKAIEEFPE